MSKKNFSRVLRIVLPLLLIGVAVGLAVWFIKTKPAPQKRKSMSSASIVETMIATAGDHRVTIEAMGTVSPVEEVILQPEVTGLIVWKHPNLVAGGMVTEGDTLLRVDARNYETMVKQQEAALEKAEVDYQLELSRSEVAAEEWRMMNPDKETDQRSRTLALREPQLRAAGAAVQAASNALFKARLDVERTEIKAPFNAVILDEFVDRGQSVSPQTRLAQLAGTDAFRIEAHLPSRDLRWITWPDKDGKGGSSATILYDTGTKELLRFQGRVTRVLSSLEQATRMARVLVRVEDPLRLLKVGGGPSNARLLSGAYVRVLIEGLPVDNAIELPGSVIREGHRVWVMNADDRLEIRDVEVIRQQGGLALVGQGVTEGDRIVSSHIPAVVPGMTLREKNKMTNDEIPKYE